MEEEFYRVFEDDAERDFYERMDKFFAKYDADQKEESALDEDLNFDDSDESWDLPDWQD